jgi:membrane protein implicated in regulation of membrane protease activity
VRRVKIGAIWSIIFGLIALIVGAIMAFTTYIGLVTSGYLFLILGIISLIIGGYDVYQK